MNGNFMDADLRSVQQARDLAVANHQSRVDQLPCRRAMQQGTDHDRFGGEGEQRRRGRVADGHDRLIDVDLDRRPARPDRQRRGLAQEGHEHGDATRRRDLDESGDRGPHGRDGARGPEQDGQVHPPAVGPVGGQGGVVHGPSLSIVVVIEQR